MVSALSSSVVDRGFESLLGQTKDYVSSSCVNFFMKYAKGLGLTCYCFSKSVNDLRLTCYNFRMFVIYDLRLTCYCFRKFVNYLIITISITGKSYIINRFTKAITGKS
jgi:hypothetical protein